METETVATFRKNSRESFVVHLTEFHGAPMADLRVFVPNRDDVEVPTAKGVAIRPDLLRPVIEALQAAEARAMVAGAHQWLTPL